MVVDNAFLDEEIQIRAAQLLYYAATGLQDTPESMMLLNKVLCGLPPDVPIPAQIDITEQEAAVTLQMLNAVLQNWDKMQNSSIENLRGAFLLREGLLKKSADFWSLQVEQKPYDIILNYLTWSISFIKPPWLNERIEVKWNTQFN